MRCPNCGNENPDDYTFCDECGAKLTAQDEATDAATNAGASADAAAAAPAAVTYAPANVVGGGGAMDPQSGSLAGASSGPISGPMAGAGGTCPNCGAPVVPGEAYCSECGAELPADLSMTGVGSDGADAGPSMQPYTPSVAEPMADAGGTGG